MKPQKLNNGANAILAQDPEEVKAFEMLLRNWEKAYTAFITTGKDPSTELYALATACANSVLKKCIDPQRKTAPGRETVSNNGVNPALAAVKNGIAMDMGTPDRPGTLDNLHRANMTAYALSYNANGDLVRIVADPSAVAALDMLAAETLTDGMDMVQTAACSIWELSAEHAIAAPGWMEQPYTMRRLSRKVLIRSTDSAKWEEVETSPIREVYRAVRREVQNSRAMQTDPRNGYLYIEDTAADPDSDKTETIYRRLHKWADLGGYTHTGDYTADTQTAADYEATVAAMNLTDRQAQIVRLRMSGYGYAAIASYLGVREDNVRLTLRRLRSKCENIGFTPAMWAEMTAEK